MQYPLVLVAAFAAASMAAPTAPPASTQSKGEMPTEVCPNDQLVFIGNVGYGLPREKCLHLKKACTRRNITEPAELKKYITDARISEVQGHQEAAQGAKREPSHTGFSPTQQAWGHSTCISRFPLDADIGYMCRWETWAPSDIRGLIASHHRQTSVAIKTRAQNINTNVVDQ
ncbi:hypothetical protein MANI_010036 [Metarhizium anisopliae]